MKALVTKVLAGGAVAAAVFAATPASAQYYPNPYGYGNGGNVVGQVISQVLGGGYGYNNGYGSNNGYGYGANSQAVVNQCMGAVQARLDRNYGYGGYGNYGGGYQPYNYGNPYNNAYGQARVLGVSGVEQRSRGGLTVRGVATTGYNAGYNGQQPIDLTFKCSTDYRGYVTDVDIDRATTAYGNGSYQPYNPYAQYGYRRY